MKKRLGKRNITSGSKTIKLLSNMKIKKTNHDAGNRFSSKILFAILTLATAKFRLSVALLALLPIIFVAPTIAAPAIFYSISVSPYGVPANTASTIHIEAEHYGRPIVNIPCTYDFYVVNSETGQTVATLDGYNQKEITLPSNSGRLSADFNVNLPEGRYYIYYVYKHTLGTEGPFSFSPIIAGNPPEPIKPLAISEFSITESWLSSLDDSEKSYFKQKGSVYDKNGTITVHMRYWHSNLANAEATVKLNGEGYLAINDGEPMIGKEFTFNADFTQPITLRIIAADGPITASKTVNGTATMDYTVTVNNSSNGDKTGLSWAEFTWYDTSIGETQHGEVNVEYGKTNAVLTLPQGALANISEDGFSGAIYTSVGASATINTQELDFELKFFGSIYDSYSYGAKFSGLNPADAPYIITITSADGTKTEEYSIQIVEKKEPANWCDHQYILGFRYRDTPGENIENPIPLSRLGDAGVQLNEMFLAEYAGKTIENGVIELMQGDNFICPIAIFLQISPGIIQNEIWFSTDMNITAGQYEVVLQLNFAPTGEEPPMHPRFVLGGITLTDKAPTTYTVNLATFANGKVTANKTAYEAGEEVRLTISNITAGYELASIEAYKTEDENEKVTLIGTGNDNYATRVFSMPTHDVTITAAFQKTQATLDAETFAAAKTAIETAIYTIDQANANTETEIEAWLIHTLNGMFDETHDIGFQPIVTDITPAIAGDQDKPNGSEGSFSFSVTLTLTYNAAIMTTETISGNIKATFYKETASTDINLQANRINTYVQNGVLHIIGLIAGESWSIYNLSGIGVYQGVATSSEEKIDLSAKGVYILKSGNQIFKILY